jgi:hypothetical protein
MVQTNNWHVTLIQKQVIIALVIKNHTLIAYYTIYMLPKSTGLSARKINDIQPPESSFLSSKLTLYLTVSKCRCKIYRLGKTLQ